MKLFKAPIHFKNSVGILVLMHISRDNWGEVHVKDITIGAAHYRSKHITEERERTLLAYASARVDIDAVLMDFENEKRGGLY